jgi:hypothetical protein
VGAVEHLKILCCLGLPPESAMMAVSPLLHEIIPHGWAQISLLDSNGGLRASYGENPELTLLHREKSLWRFMDDPSSPMSLLIPAFRAVAIGYSLQLQGPGWLETAWYREVGAPLDGCWLLDAMIGDGQRSIAFLCLNRPRTARPFCVGDVKLLDRLRPWLAHAFRQNSAGEMGKEIEDSLRSPGEALLSGQAIVTPNAAVVFQSASFEHLLEILIGGGNYIDRPPPREGLPAPVLKLVRRIVGAANGDVCAPPRMRL